MLTLVRSKIFVFIGSKEWDSLSYLSSMVVDAISAHYKLVIDKKAIHDY